MKLRLYHDNGDPDTVTELLGIKPTRIQRVGEVSHFPEMGLLSSGWFLEFSGDHNTLGAAIQQMVGVIESHAAALADLRGQHWRMHFDIDVDAHLGYTGNLLSPGEMRVLADAGIDCQLWTFAMPPDPE